MKNLLGIVLVIQISAMKKFLLPFLFFAASSMLHAQNSVQYKILADEPMRACNFAMGVELAQMDFGFRNIDGLSFSTGVWGFVDYKRMIGADYTFRYGYLTMGKSFRDKENLKAHRQIELGLYLPLSHRLVTAKNKVVLKVETSSNNTGGQVETTTFVMVPSTQFRSFGLRAGFMDFGGCLTMDNAASDADFNLPDVVNYNVIGLYAGIFTEKMRSVLITTDSYGKKGTSLHSRFYLDAIIAPVSSVKYKDVDYKDKFSHSPIGARMGVAWYPVLTRKEARPDFKGRRFLFQTEVGIRPYDGVFLTATISIPISRHIAKLSDGSDKPAQQNETE